MPKKIIPFQETGQRYHEFEVIKSTPISELHCQLIELVHMPTGAKVMHIANDDSENLFCLSFQTIPVSSNGVAHILEHTVLCGSRKFPVKDPFFAMQRRSLNTFMNALTGADFTCYPAATQVPKDFYNLLDVYLDAVFHPNLNEMSFIQEGCRLEFANPSDPNSPLEYKGIVFNEMKGALTNPNARLNEAISEALFPDLTYGINSGGDPKHIPELTYQELRNFHDQYYHPSRCLFFFYGNMPLQGHLDFIAEKVLNETKPREPLPPLPLQSRFQAPHRIIKTYPIPAEENTFDKTMMAFGWLTCHILEQQELLALNILEIILMDTDASPLKMALLKSGLCKQALCYMDDEMSEVPIILTLKGCNPEKADDLEDLLRQKLKEIVRQGIPLNMVENAIHQLEFHRSEITGDHVPFGLSLFMRSALLKQHGGDAERGLKIHSLFDDVRRRNLEDPTYLTKLIEKHFLNNPHFVRLALIPDRELGEKELLEEKSKLKALQEGMSDEEKQYIIKKSSQLEAFQYMQEEENGDILPKVTLSDVPHNVRTYSLSEEKAGSLDVFHHHCFTNEIVYADLVFDLPDIVEGDLPYARLLSTLISQMGCKGRNYAENLEYIQAHTGGIGASLVMNPQAENHRKFFPSFYIRGKALHRKTPKLFTLIHEIVSSIDFTDKHRLKEVILKQVTALESSLNQNALKYAVNLSSQGLDIASKVANAWYGLEYLSTMRSLAQDFDTRADWLVGKLQMLQDMVLGGENPDLVVTCDAAMYDEIKGHGFYGLQDLATHPISKWQGNYPLMSSSSQGRIIASPIAFIGKAFKTISYSHPDAPALSIAAFLFDNLTLHTSLREKGGAYGGGAVSSPMSGSFYFYSYRDPNVLSTLNAFEKAIEEVLSGHFEESDIEEAKIEMTQSLDAPVAPGSRGDIAYGWLREGKTIALRQAFRDRMLSLKSEDIIRAVERQIVPNFSKSATVVFAGKELLEKENAKLIADRMPSLPIKNIFP